MKLVFSEAALLFFSYELWNCNAFVTKPTRNNINHQASSQNNKPNSALFVSIGLGPEKDKEKEEEKELVAGVDYEVPNHEEFRTSRRSKVDEKADEWYGKLMGSEENDGIMGELAKNAREILTTPVPLVNDEPLPTDHEEWTPYVTTKLPWTPLTPAYGLEEFGLPVPRRNAETWRHFDVVGMIEQDYSTLPEDTGKEITFSDEKAANYEEILRSKGGWLEDDNCLGRLVYVNGRYAPQLSKPVDSMVENVNDITSLSEEAQKCLARLTDGFTDELAAPVPINDGEYYLTSHKKLSGPNHNMGEPTSQFAINTQQGTACFAALNTLKTGAVAFVHGPAGSSEDDENEPKPVIIVNAITKDGGASGTDADAGVACHPRALVIAEEKSNMSVVQSCVDLDADEGETGNVHRAKLYNGFTQFFVKAGANVTHSYIDESGGIVTPGVELSDDDIEESERPREVESKRPALKDTHLEAIDVHIVGEAGSYEATMVGVGGSGRVRTALSVSLLKPTAQAVVNGFLLSGGAQKTDMKTNIHHIADGTISRQMQKNMIGGRAVGAFRGRIRVEQSAQQTDSEQLSRTILLSDRARAWSLPSLEIIADDVKCAHGATVSDLSEEELFYLRSRGLDRKTARNLLMYAFAGDITSCINPAMLGEVDSAQGLQKRVIERLQNLVPQGDRAVKGEFQSV